MKRDFDLIRKILLEIENLPAGSPYVSFTSFEGYELPVVNEHLELLIESDLVKGETFRDMQGNITATVQRLTSSGHDFLDASKGGIWEKAKEKILVPGASITIELLLTWMKQKAAETLGIGS